MIKVDAEQNLQRPVRPKVIMLEVYDTLLDMTLVERRVNDLMGNKRGYRIWFELFMQYCFVDNCTLRFNDFFAIAGATFKMAAKLFNRTITQDERRAVLELLRHLPLQGNAQPGLSSLVDQGYRLAALTNGPQSLVADRMARTGLVSYFDEVMSAGAVKKYKPCWEVYQWAADRVHTEVSEVLFVSSHGWDIAGAANAGMQTAYLQSSDKLLYPLAPAPYLTISTLEELADQLSSKWKVL